MANRSFKGRQKGAKNKQRQAMPLADALEVLDRSAAQPVPIAADILGATECLVYQMIHSGDLKAIRLGRFWRVPSVVIRQMILPQNAA